MILLRANQELKMTYDRLIQTMKVPVQWNGIFVVIDNYIILQGKVRSLFFHFDSRKVITNVIDIPVKEEDVQETDGNVHVRNVINMILYVFGKWGTINGLKVEKNYAQLNQLFKQILHEIQVEPEYNQEHFCFYKDGIRVTYEDVVQYALEYEEKQPEETEESGGLWHNLVWKYLRADFRRVETTLSERLRGRLGNNFYMVGYLCPSCGKKLHMVVYPRGKEFQIETEEGAVLLARAATCDTCNSFYTPVPDQLFSDGDVYEMQFGEDKKAYEDYLELIGKKGERVSNNRFNEFVNKKRAGRRGEEEETLDEFCEELSEHSIEEVRRVEQQMEEGFYPDATIQRLERKIKAHSKGTAIPEPEKKAKGLWGKSARKKGQQEGIETRENKKLVGADSGAAESKRNNHKQGNKASSSTAAEQAAGSAEQKENATTRISYGIPAETGGDSADSGGDGGRTQEEREKFRQKYEAKLKICDRFSKRQLRDFKEELGRDSNLTVEERRQYMDEVAQRLASGRIEQLSKKMDACEGKTYAVIKRVFEDVEKEDLPMSEKQPFLDKLQGWLKEQGEREVWQMMLEMPPNMDRTGYRQFLEKIHSYEGVDITPYEDRLRDAMETAERREVADIVRRARKITKEDLKELEKRLEEGDFLPELILPYQEKIDAKIRQMEEAEIAEICPAPFDMSFEEGIKAYKEIANGDFLPELKEDALKMLTKRLSKIKTDECELLVKKLKEELAEHGIAENQRHYFYPAKKVMLEQALPEETEVIDFAMASYAAGRGLFEYPIFVVDSSRNGSGKEGIILTPDHLYYSTFLNAYGIEMPIIEKITASTGLLNRGIYVHQKNGTKTKVPYAVETKELPAYARVLDDMVHYLQEKPESRKVDYLAKEKHDTICCFRCGYMYKGGDVCPKCGYKNNE